MSGNQVPGNPGTPRPGQPGGQTPRHPGGPGPVNPNGAMPGYPTPPGNNRNQANPDNQAQKARRRWTIAIVAASVLLAILVIVLVVMWVRGGSDQGARSACTKASQDLTSQYESLQGVVSKAEDTLAIVDPETVPDPKLLEDLKTKTEAASQPVEPVECKGEDLAGKTSKMMTQADTLKKQQTELEDAIKAIEEAGNLQSLSGVKKTLEEKISEGEQLAQAAEAEGVSTEVRAALSAQIEDAKRLIDQVNDLKTLSDEKAKDLSEAMRASVDRLTEDITAMGKSIAENRAEKAQKEAEEQLRRQQQMFEEQQRQQQNQGCNVGDVGVDANGRRMRCRNVLDPATGEGRSMWVAEDETEDPGAGDSGQPDAQ